MATQPHKVWKVRVGSFADATIVSRTNGRSSVSLANCPERAVYIIEAKGQGTRAEKKAKRTAAEDGIRRPVVLSIEWMNPPW